MPKCKSRDTVEPQGLTENRLFFMVSSSEHGQVIVHLQKFAEFSETLETIRHLLKSESQL